MEDKLKIYIENNTSEFNNDKLYETDKLKMWSKIEAEIAPTIKVIPLWQKTPFRIAASIVVLFACSLLFFKLNTINSEEQIVNQELYQIDNHYKGLVNNQVELIKINTNLSQEEKEEFLLLADELDIEYKKLKKELSVGINNQKILEAIINNYKKKIKLMEDLLERSYPINNNFDNSEIIL